MRSILGVFLSLFFTHNLIAAEFEEMELEADAALQIYGKFLNQNQMKSRAEIGQDNTSAIDYPMSPEEIVFPSDPTNPGELFPSDSSNPFPSDPSGGDYLPPYYPGYSSSMMGSAYLIAMRTMYQTLMFYGVAHVVRRQGNRIDFQIVRSKNGYFTNLDRLQVTYALREFSRYILALLCGDATQERFYQMFAQVPAEEIGLRFKYDMAWALLGNPLPKNANEVLAMGEKWRALRQILSSTGSLQQPSEENKELKNWASGITDVVNILNRLNQIACYVDVRPNPKQELKKRIVIKKLLMMERDLYAEYQKYEEILKEMEAANEEQKHASFQEFTQ